MMMNNAFNGFSNSYFGQQVNPNGFGVQSGLAFNNVAPAKSTSSTQEELQKIKSMGGTNFKFDLDDQAIAGWDFRDGTLLCLELIDSATDRVRAKWTNEEFNVVLVEDAVVAEVLDMLKNIVDTTKLLNTSLDKDVSKQIYIAAGVLFKLLPTAYANGRKNYNNVIAQCRQQVGAVGYQGNFGQNGMMFAGQYGQAPNYFVNDSSSAPNMGFVPNYNGAQPMMQQNMFDPSTIQQAAYILQAANQMGVPTQPTGGTMMGGNPFVQGGQPQAVPQMNNTPSVPFPGTPNNQQQQTQQGTTFNPPIGQPVNNPAANTATTTTAPF